MYSFAYYHKLYHKVLHISLFIVHIYYFYDAD